MFHWCKSGIDIRTKIVVSFVGQSGIVDVYEVILFRYVRKGSIVPVDLEINITG